LKKLKERVQAEELREKTSELVPALVFAVVSALVALFERQPAPVLPTSAAFPNVK
jgi:hypothetical protein